MMAVRHLYIHIPFCARRCSYCDFSIAVRSSTPIDEYCRALRAELALGAIQGATLNTVYLGGGTPSRLGGPGVTAVLAMVREHATITSSAEITIEANPDDVNDIAVAQWVAAGVNRISLGSQSFDDAVLKWMHRTHDSAQIDLAVRTIRGGGIENISLDLIFALPAHLDRDWMSDIAHAIALAPSHLSLYGLTIEPHTAISRWVDRGIVVEGSDSQYEDEFLYAHEAMCAAGFEHYEVSNFSLPGKASRHNSAYWSGAAYAGIGPSAHSFDGMTRRWNVPAYAEWVRRLASGTSVIGGEEILTDENRDAEKVYLGLRTAGGLALEQSELDVPKSWQTAGWASLANGRVSLTALGWLRLDSLVAALIAKTGVQSAPPIAKSVQPVLNGEPLSQVTL